MIGDSSQGLCGVLGTRGLAKDAGESMVGTLASHQLHLHCQVPSPFSSSVREIEFFGGNIEQVSELVMWVVKSRVSLSS